MTNYSNKEQQEKELFSQLKPIYLKSKEDVWSTMEKTIKEKQTVKKNSSKTIRLVWLKYSAAASIVILIGLGLFARLYTTTVNVPTGQTSEHTLPDGSIIYLNTGSSINYHPYWWNINREVELCGEAFFEVKKGKKFSVSSDMGNVDVLGTSFNVYDRDGAYSVYCKTGKVKVQDEHSNEVILSPGQLTNVENNILQTPKEFNANQIMAWRMNKFLYNTTPITKVLNDFELYYGIDVETNIKNINDLHYTGLFMRNIGAEKALDIISFSFELNVEKTGKNTYLINY